jgi:hypothetical protein
MATVRRASRAEVTESLPNGWLVALGIGLIQVGVILGLAFSTWLPAIWAAAVIAVIAATARNIRQRWSARHRGETESSPSGESSEEEGRSTNPDSAKEKGAEAENGASRSSSSGGIDLDEVM